MQSAPKGTTRLGHKARLKQVRAGENPGSEALLQLSVRSPSHGVSRESRPMLSWPFSPPRRTRPAVGPKPSPHVFAARPSTLPRRGEPANRLATLQGLDPTSPGGDSEEPSQPP